MTGMTTMANRRTAGRGFTLVELMIVISIIAVIAALAIPSIVESRRLAEERAALGMLRSIYSGQQAHKAKFGTYAADLPTLVADGMMPGSPFKTSGGPVQTKGMWEYSTRVPFGGDASVSFAIMAEPVGTTTADRYKHGDQIYFMLDTGAIYTHREPSGCSLMHGDATIQSFDDASIIATYPPTDGL